MFDLTLMNGLINDRKELERMLYWFDYAKLVSLVFVIVGLWSSY